MTYADIIVDISHEKLDKSFQYLVPQQLEEQIQVGMVVQIPFGRGNHVRKGYVVGLSSKLKVDGSCIKSIVSIENDQETIESRLIALAGWMKEHYGSTMIQALKTVLPIQKKVKAQEKRWQEHRQTLTSGSPVQDRNAIEISKKLLQPQDRIFARTGGGHSVFHTVVGIVYIL